MPRSQVVADAAGHYVHLGVIQISVTNLAIIGLMLVVFVAALLIPFPRPRGEDEQDKS